MNNKYRLIKLTENGEVENWAGGDKSKVYEEVKKELEKAKAFKI